MKKIPNLFERDWNGNKSRVLPELHKGADVEWVLRGEGVATVKWDGSAIMWDGKQLFVRYDSKIDPRTGQRKTPPPGFQPCQDPDPETGHWPGWIPAEGNPAAKWHLAAFNNTYRIKPTPPPGTTLEACGPHLQSNPYDLPYEWVFVHGWDRVEVACGSTAPYAYGWLTGFLSDFTYQAGPMSRAKAIEGIVFHHPDGRMAKVLSSDLGVSWKAKVR